MNRLGIKIASSKSDKIYIIRKDFISGKIRPVLSNTMSHPFSLYFADLAQAKEFLRNNLETFEYLFTEDKDHIIYDSFNRCYLKLNVPAVYHTVHQLLDAGSEISTLSVKNRLRLLGYFAKQEHVSIMLSYLYERMGLEKFFQHKNGRRYLVYCTTGQVVEEQEEQDQV